MKKWHIKNEEEMIALGRQLGQWLDAGDLVLLEGDLGAGKTTLTKGIGQGLGVTKVINSPTFTILKVYQGRVPLYHMDVYRLEGMHQELGFEEYYDGDGVCVVEWATFVAEELPLQRLEITITHETNGRLVQMTAKGEHYEEIIEKVKM
ncbi:tRNA threonylcarbamoyladenosine biosynthesis protein TsaE [Clostridiales bacterium CHKCI006]|uniref:tRNA threonylcarbamoyladenosine biosynthesis protein TsaE n=1 Tax=Candidatus Fimiplasma intestinipullorum TaxID=2840825 RepID=A0A9D1HP50_9FIRM|nr:tRNA threonylcarbamoyladenosine biosynthesis protein TsaE [Clostridiales bacterium CHKCI006]HIU14138.1 tRNA (adenosine(37)-N6)-threonylcarbamoyltransferase complex ATPase subunit type 1 TsaE [Candidatus Fimiplasma intestinipullorum]